VQVRDGLYKLCDFGLATTAADAKRCNRGTDTFKAPEVLTVRHKNAVFDA